MANGDSDVPRGLNMSLDDIIAENSKSKKLQNKGQHYGKSNQYQQGSRGRGRGGRGGGRGAARGGRTFGRGGRSQQQNVQSYGQSYNAQPERIVVVQEQTPNLEYRQVEHKSG